MKRSDFPLPYTTGLVDLNSEGAYADQGMTLRNYPRFMPTPYKSIAPREDRLVLEPWRKNMKLYPQIYFLLSRDVPVRDTSPEPVVLAVGIVGATPLPKRWAERIQLTPAGAVLEPVLSALLLVLCTAYLVDGSFSPFLYFRF